MLEAETFIYVIGSVDGPKKIGLSAAPAKRLRGLQTGHQARLEVLHSRRIDLKEATSIERRAHWLLRDCRAHGEWFAVDLSAAKRAVEAAAIDRGEGEKVKPSVGRPKINDEQTPARFPAGTLARIDASLAEDEARSDFIREAVERELKRRARLAHRPSSPRA